MYTVCSPSVPVKTALAFTAYPSVCPSQRVASCLLLLRAAHAAGLAHTPVPDNTSGGSSLLPSTQPMSFLPGHKESIWFPSAQTRLVRMAGQMDAFPGSPSPVLEKSGPQERSLLPSLLLPPPEPLALPPLPVALDQRRTVSLNPPA